MISVACVEFMGDKRLSFLVDCNIKEMELTGHVMGYNYQFTHFLNAILLSHHHLDP